MSPRLLPLVAAVCVILAPGPSRGAAPPRNFPGLDLYGDPLPSGALARLGTVRLRHAPALTCWTFARDGRTLVTSNGRTVRFWEAGTGRLVRQLAAGTAGTPIRVLALSPDGKTVAVGDLKGTVSVLDAATGRVRCAPGEGLKDSFACLAFSPDGKTLALCGAKGLTLWDPATGAYQGRLGGPDDEAVQALDFSGDGRLLATANRAGVGVVWDCKGGHQVRRLPATWVALAGDANRAVTAVKDRGVAVWDLAAAPEVRRFAEKRRIYPTALSPDGKTLAAHDGLGSTVFWDVNTGKERFFCRGGGALFSADGKAVAVQVGDAALALFRAAPWKEVAGPAAHRQAVTAVSFSPDGRSLATGSPDGALRVWRAADGRAGPAARASYRRAAPFAFLPDGRTVAVANGSHGLLQWDAVTGREKREARPEERFMGRAVAFSPGGSLLVGASGPDAVGRGELVLWSARRQAGLGSLDRSGGERRFWEAVAFSPGARFVAATHERYDPAAVKRGANRSLVVWATGTRKVVAELDVAGPAYFPARLLLAPGGRTLVLLDDRLRLFDVEAKRPRRWPAPTLRDPPCAALSPDGRLLAYGDGDGAVRVWELYAGQEVARWDGHGGPVRALAFSPDGARLASGSDDTTALVWDVLGVAGRARRPHNARELEPLWRDLASADGARAHRAVGALTASPSAARLLRERLRPAAAADRVRVAALVARLDDEDFDVCKRAEAELRGMGKTAEVHLRNALRREPSLETHRRIERLLARLADEALTADELRARRAVAVLEYRRTDPLAQRLLLDLAKGAPEAWLTQWAKDAAARLARPAP